MAYSDIKDPSAHFQTKTYTGTNNSNALTNDGNSDLKPDFIWIKRRDYNNGHQLLDSTRGVDKILGSELSSAETTLANRLSSFDTDGFTVECSSGAFNASGEPFVAWQWKANGGTTSSNTTGTITSTVQANTDAGFSIVTWAGTASTATIGHGLGVAPKVVLVRARDKNVPTSWIMFHKDGSTSDDDYLILQGTFAKNSQAGLWNNQYPSSTVFGIANDFWVNSASTNYLAYCFAEVEGYSKFGKYVGNGNANGSFVYTGFKPAMIILKRTDATNNWLIYDHKRSGYNPKQDKLYPDDASAEDASTTSVDLLSNGFKLRASSASQNASGGTYIYMAFAENPFVAGGIPTTAR